MGPVRGAARMLPFLLTATILIVALIVLTAAHRDRSTRSTLLAGAVTYAFQADLELRALEYTRTRYKVVSGIPRAVLTRDLTTDDVRNLGTCGYAHDPDDPRYQIVVLEGDLDLGEMPGSDGLSRHPDAERYRFIAYVYDSVSQSITPVAEYTSRNGGILRNMLHDPSLPDDVPPGSPPGTRQVDLTVGPASCPPSPSEQADIPSQVAPTTQPDSRE